MAKHHGAKHLLFRKLLGFRFNHQNGVRCAGNHKIKIRGLHLLLRRVQNELAIDEADPRPANRAHEGNAGNGKGCGSADKRHDIAVIFEVVGEHRGDHLGFIAETFREKRADGAVDQAGNQCFLFRWPAFALEIAAGNLARGIGLFLVVHGEREKINSGLFRACGNCRGKNRRLAVGYNNCAICLARHAAGFNAQGLSGPFQFFNIYLKHVTFLFCSSPPLPFT